jgi:SAM-dependent methyltransferase
MNPAANFPDAPPRRATKRRLSLLQLGTALAKVLVGYLLLFVALAAWNFPWQVDQPTPRLAELAEGSTYYKGVYAPTVAVTPEKAEEPGDSRYVAMARDAIEREKIVPKLKEFVTTYGLEQRTVLDVGAGTGYLQDLVEDYVGLDISPSARRYFHKSYVEASATDMPFRDNEFDGAWSIWVLEHVPNPEQALSEIRRVVKDGGVLFLRPAWACGWWLSEGYPVRPYADFGLAGKLKKATLPVAMSPYYQGTFLLASRFARKWQRQLQGGPTRLHYTELEPNYDKYWMSDSDAVNNLDYYEMLQWFLSRGDECLNCTDDPIYEGGDLLIRVHKPNGASLRASR